MNLDNAVLVTHRGCMDGSTCALVFIAAGGDKENIFFSTPSHSDTDALVKYLLETTDSDIIVADASISLKLAEKIDKGPRRVKVLDHHKSAIPINKFSWCEIDVENTRAGGMMLYDWFYEVARTPELEPLDNLVMAADDYDRWIRKHPDSEDLVTLHDAIEQESFIERFEQNPYVIFSEKERYLIDVYKAKRDRFVEKKKKDAEFVTLNIQGHNVKVGFVEAGTHQSILGNAICSDPELSADIAVMINSRSVSLRASADCPVDVSKMAKFFMGGGHIKAGGFSLSALFNDAKLVDIVKERILEENWAHI